MINIESVLTEYYKNYDTKDLALLFERYMQEIGARKLDRRRKDTSNTYQNELNHISKKGYLT